MDDAAGGGAMTQSIRAPVAVFAYRRVSHLQSMMKSLQDCDGFADSAIVIFADGYKGEADKNDVLEVHRYVRELTLPNVQVEISGSNKGLRRSIHEGVSELTERYGRVIVLEDDLVLAPSALEYFNMALDAYSHADRVKAICGYMYDVETIPVSDRCCFLPFASSWGWATWRRAWEEFHPLTETYRGLSRSPSFRRFFRAPGIVESNLMLGAQLQGLIDSWAVLWNAHIIAQGGLCLFPPRTVIRNSGLSSGSGTHSSDNFLQKAMLGMQSSMALSTHFILPTRVQIDFARMDAIAASPQVRLQRILTVLGYLRRRTRALFRG